MTLHEDRNPYKFIITPPCVTSVDSANHRSCSTAVCIYWKNKITYKWTQVNALC